jgi:hypothetical protein
MMDASARVEAFDGVGVVNGEAGAPCREVGRLMG